MSSPRVRIGVGRSIPKNERYKHTPEDVARARIHKATFEHLLDIAREHGIGKTWSAAA